MWSLGCVLVELLVGKPLFPASDECDLIKRFVFLKGEPPQHMLISGRRTHKVSGPVPVADVAARSSSARARLTPCAHLRSVIVYLVARIVHPVVGSSFPLGPPSRSRCLLTILAVRRLRFAARLCFGCAIL